MSKINMRYTPENITSLEPGEVFVFGSNEAGKHGLGAARLAFVKFGAVTGIGEGLSGQSYAIPTKDKQLRTLPLGHILPYVMEFLKYARRNPAKTFLVTKIGCGLAGYTPEKIAPMFVSVQIPDNVILPKEFWDQYRGFWKGQEK